MAVGLGALTMFALPSLALAHRATKTQWHTWKFSVEYRGNVKIAYDGWISTAPTGPPECVRTIHGTAVYRFDQFWDLDIQVRRLGNGHYIVRNPRIIHGKGPAPDGLFPDPGQATQSGEMTNCAYDFGQKADNGKFNCTSETMSYRSWHNPQALILPGPTKGTVTIEWRAWLDQTGAFKGTDEIPTDDSCGSFFNEWGGTYGADILPGDAATVKTVLRGDSLARLKRTIGTYIHWDPTWQKKRLAPNAPTKDCTLDRSHINARCTLDMAKSALRAELSIDG